MWRLMAVAFKLACKDKVLVCIMAAGRKRKEEAKTESQVDHPVESILPIRAALLSDDDRLHKHLSTRLKQFTKFLLEDERIETDPFRKLRPPKVSELRHRRRTLAPDECTKFLKAVRECSPSYGLSGPDQEVLFRVALNTGFRASELSRLVVADLHLDCEYPHISLSASKTKNRDEACIPLRDPEVVQILKDWIVGKLRNEKLRNEKLWAGNWASSSGGSRMVQKALKVAEIPYEVDGRKVDFHALRYTFITNLIKAGETPAYVQRLARHSDINLTLRVYTDLGLADLYHGRLRDSHESPLPATGTPNDAPPEQSDKPPDEYLTDKGGSKSVAQNVAHFSVSEGLSASLDVTEGDNEEGANQPQEDNCDTPQRQKATGDNTSCRSVSQENNKRRGGDSNPRYLSVRRFSRPVHSAALPPLQLCQKPLRRGIIFNREGFGK